MSYKFLLHKLMLITLRWSQPRWLSKATWFASLTICLLASLFYNSVHPDVHLSLPLEPLPCAHVFWLSLRSLSRTARATPFPSRSFSPLLLNHTSSCSLSFLQLIVKVLHLLAVAESPAPSTHPECRDMSIQTKDNSISSLP